MGAEGREGGPVTGTPAPRGSRAPGDANGPVRDTVPGPAYSGAAAGRTETRRPKCSMADRYSDLRCWRPAAHRVILGCIHEHMLVGFTCKDHLKAIRGERLIACARCLEGPDPHECPTLGREATRDEQKKAIDHA